MVVVGCGDSALSATILQYYAAVGRLATVASQMVVGGVEAPIILGEQAAGKPALVPAAG